MYIFFKLKIKEINRNWFQIIRKKNTHAHTNINHFHCELSWLFRVIVNKSIVWNDVSKQLKS